MELVEGTTLAGSAQRRASAGRRGADDRDARSPRRSRRRTSEGIIHRDLKPANIKVTPGRHGEGARLRAGEGRPGCQTSVPLPMATHARIILGTAPYMSPEQARGLAVDKRADIWAFGCVLYEMLTGRTAFAGETVRIRSPLSSNARRTGLRCPAMCQCRFGR